MNKKKKEYNHAEEHWKWLEPRLKEVKKLKGKAKEQAFLELWTKDALVWGDNVMHFHWNKK